MDFDQLEMDQRLDHSQEKSRDASVTSNKYLRGRDDGWSNELVCFHQIGLIHKQAIVCTMGGPSGEAHSYHRLCCIFGGCIRNPVPQV